MKSTPKIDQSLIHVEPRGATSTVLLAESIERLENWLNGNYEGWDPYDGTNSEKGANFIGAIPYVQMGLIQFHRLSPINMREFFGVRKGVSTKGLSLFMQALLTLYSATTKVEYLDEASRLSKLIIDRSLIDKYGRHAWASHYFTFVSLDGGTTTPDAFDLIGTCNVLKALSMLHQITGEKGLEEIIGSCQSFLQTQVEQKNGLQYFRYAPMDGGKVIPNGSAEALGAIAISFKSRRNEELQALCDGVLRSLLHLQREDGSWIYSIYPDGREYDQMDFHQGYIIGGLSSYREYADPELHDEIDRAIGRGAIRYKEMFQPDGRGLYRAPKKYPVEIHNQAQGIITFSHLGEIYGDRSFIALAERIANWTITNMQDESGYFHYKKGVLVTNKIPYMRWGQAWMLLALALLYAVEKKDAHLVNWAR